MVTDETGRKKGRERGRRWESHTVWSPALTPLSFAVGARNSTGQQIQVGSHRAAGVSRSQVLGVHGPVPDIAP